MTRTFLAAAALAAFALPSAASAAAPTCVTGAERIARQGTDKRIDLRCSDADGDSLTVTVTRPPLRGTVSPVLRDDNGYFVTYSVLAPGGTDSFAFRASDGTSSSAETEQPVRPVAANHNTAPSCQPRSLDVDRDGFALVQAECSDAEDDPLAIRVLDQAQRGAVTAETQGSSSRVYRYTPAAGYTGPDAFTYTANDGRADAPQASVALQVRQPTPPTCTIPPEPQPAFQAADTRVSVSCAPGSDGARPLRYVLESGPAHGTFRFDPAEALGSTTGVYRPQAGYVGADQVSFHVLNPSNTRSATYTLRFDAQPSQYAPPSCASNKTPVTARGGEERRTSFLCAFDAPGKQWEIEVVRTPAHGAITNTDIVNDNTNLGVTYRSDPGFVGTDSFEIRVRDTAGQLGNSVVQTMNVIAPGTNRGPVCRSRPQLTRRNEGAYFLTSCADPEDDPLTFAIQGQPAHGTAMLDDGRYSTRGIWYTPAPGYVGHDCIRYAASDGVLSSGETRMQVEIKPNETPPPSDCPVDPFGPIGVGGGGPGGGGAAGGGSGGGGATTPPGAPAPARPAPAATPPPPPAPTRPAPSIAAVAPAPALRVGPVRAYVATTSGNRTVTPTAGQARLLRLSCSTACSVRVGMRLRARSIALPSSVLRLAAGRSGTVRLRLPASVRKRLRSVSSTRLQVSLRTRDASGRIRLGTTSFTIRLR